MAVSVDIETKLHGFTLKVKLESDGSPIGILGASGSGKSMTLRCIAGIQTPDSGRIVVNDKVLFDSEKKINLKPQERKVGYLFQNYALFPTMTVEKNIACGYRGDKKHLKAKVADYIERYQLNGLEKRYPEQIADAVIRYFKEEKEEEFAQNVKAEEYKYSWDRMTEVVEELWAR